LSYDLKDTNVGVHSLVPGWTFTGLICFSPSLPHIDIVLTREYSGNVPSTDKTKPDGAWSPEQVVEYMHKKMLNGKFYIICPNNDVSEETDKKRMLWSVGDIVNERSP
jgi:short-subunit dehydrogenase